jgi:hypothetical protein
VAKTASVSKPISRNIFRFEDPESGRFAHPQRLARQYYTLSTLLYALMVRKYLSGYYFLTLLIDKSAGICITKMSLP